MSKNMKFLVKTLHLLSASLWLGAATSTVLLQCLQGWSQDSGLLLALNRNFSILDFGLIIPGAIGSALTGFIMCKKTSWGFTRYRWVMTKGVLTIIAILIGTFCLGPWQLKMVELSRQPQHILMADASYNLIRILYTTVAFIQVVMLILIVTISALKPWGKRLPRQTEPGKVEHRNASAA